MKPIVFYPERRYLIKLYLVSIPVHLFLAVWLGSAFVGFLRTMAVAGHIFVIGLLLYVAAWLLLTGLYFRSIRYEVTDDDMTASAGFLNQTKRHIRYQAIIDVQVMRDWLDRLLGIGTLHVRVGGASLPVITMSGVGDIYGLYEFVVEAMRRKQDALLNQQERLADEQQDILLMMYDELRAMRTGELPLPAGETVRKLKSGED